MAANDNDKITILRPQASGLGKGSDKAVADALFLSIGEGAIVIDADGKVSRINKTALDMLGFEPDEIIGKWYPDIVIAEDENGRRMNNIERPIAEVFLSGKSIFRKLYYRRKDGSKIAVALTVSPALLDGKPIGAIEIFRDISEEVRLDKAKDEFISLASHQLRTPATGVKQYIGMLLDGYGGRLTKTQRNFLKIANQSNDRQLRIIDDILKVAAADSGNMVLSKAQTDLVSLITSVIDEQRSKFEAKSQLIAFEAAEPVSAEVDIDLFRMVLENLIDNAHKYSLHGKKITVSLAKKDACTVIRIKDQGTGIETTDFDKLFQKFSRLDNPLSVTSGGTGLGLYWVKQIVRLHNGRIDVRSKIGKGTMFTITLEPEEPSLVSL